MEDNVRQYVAKTLYGFEHLLGKEIAQMGAKQIEERNRAVNFKADWKTLVDIHATSRLAIRVIHPFHKFQARHERDFYNQARVYPWENHFSVDQTFKIDARVFSDTFTHSKYISLKLKDAICDRFRDLTGDRPNINVQDPDIVFSLDIRDQQVQLALDATGESLHRRGFRDDSHVAPMNEILAAGILAKTEWKPDLPFIDGMTGSGTMLIEALYRATKQHASWNRKRFPFMQWPDYPKGLWESQRDYHREQVYDHYPEITGIEIDKETYRSAYDNLVRAGLSPFHYLKQHDFFSYKPKQQAGIVFLNPPYDKRLSLEDVQEFYGNIGDHLKQHFTGWDAWILVGNPVAAKSIGLRSTKRLKLFNGSIESRLMHFPLYEGSKK